MKRRTESGKWAEPPDIEAQVRTFLEEEKAQKRRDPAVLCRYCAHAQIFWRKSNKEAGSGRIRVIRCGHNPPYTPRQDQWSWTGPSIKICMGYEEQKGFPFSPRKKKSSSR